MQIIHWLNLEEADFPVFFWVRSVKLYYLHDGRNAWWSIWVQRYKDECVFTSMYTAKNTAERRRVQGSVFYILEMPGLLFEGPGFDMCVTEINTEHILDIEHDAMRWPDIGSVFDFFEPRRPNSILRLHCNSGERADAEDCAETDIFRTYRSSSEGVSYLLSWHEIEAPEMNVAGVEAQCHLYRKVFQRWPFLGWRVKAVEEGIEIDPVANGPADSAGLMSEDIITSVRDIKKNKTIWSLQDLAAFESSMKRPGDYELEVLRWYEKHTVRFSPPSLAGFRRRGDYERIPWHDQRIVWG